MKLKDLKEYKKVLENIKDTLFDGNIDVKEKKITSLEGAPKIIYGGLNVRKNFLKTLEYSPKKILGHFDCSYNEITSLKGSPEEIKGIFDCSNNKLKTLEGNIKDVYGSFDCRLNPELKNIKEQIIKYQIKARMYYTDEGSFPFEDIQKDFEEYVKKQEMNKKDLKKIKNEDFGFGF